ncbi:hypothetical protein QMZ05_12480 [Bradyrhizobium sp. INPA03-11B]|uniref:hypothetical protein n=1 Tax=Bradyrhizobium sp. INPA03-11B TaxID=418598 RepID=UPI00338FDF77
MGYQERSEGIAAFSQGVISVFFRVPAASISAAKAFFDADDVGVPMSGIIPLIVFGKRGEYQNVNPGRPATIGDPGASIVGSYQDHHMVPDTSSNPVTGYTEASGSPVTINQVQTRTVTNGSPGNSDPSYIGLDCRSGTPRLRVHLETDEKPTIAWFAYDMTGYTSTDTYNYNPTTVTDVSGFHFVPHAAIPNVTRTQTMTDASMVGYVTAAYDALTTPTITGDVWHHALVSFDLSIACKTNGTRSTTNESGAPTDPPQNINAGTVSAPRIWVALDDGNLTGSDLSQYWPAGASDRNIVLTSEATSVAVKQNLTGGTAHLENFPGASDPQPYTITNTISVGEPSYSVGPSVIPAGTASIGIPAPGAYENIIQDIILVDVQVYTGKTIDTGIESKRRSFISATGKPVDPSLAIAAMGKRPEVFFQTAGDWSSGVNRGTAGNFVKTGTFTAFTPVP